MNKIYYQVGKQSLWREKFVLDYRSAFVRRSYLFQIRVIFGAATEYRIHVSCDPRRVSRYVSATFTRTFEKKYKSRGFETFIDQTRDSSSS